MKNFNLFNYIVNQIKNNVRAEYSNDIDDVNTSSFTVKGKQYPTNVLQYLCKTQGAFKIDVDNIKIDYKVDKYGNNIYTIKYKDLDLNAPCLKHLKKYDKSLDRLKLNDEIRFDDYECKSVSKDVLTDYDGAFCSEDNVEHLEYTDDCTFDLYAQMKGYTPEQLQSLIESGYISRDIIQMEYIEFLEQAVAKDYEIGREFEEEYELI